MVPRTFENIGKCFFVSTSILILASGYFDRLSNGRMVEVHDLPNRRSVSFDVDEENLQALKVILRTFPLPDGRAIDQLRLKLNHENRVTY